MMSFKSKGRIGRKERRTLKLIAAGWVPQGRVIRHPKKRHFVAPLHVTGSPTHTWR
jgi:hypothetical protein